MGKEDEEARLDDKRRLSIFYNGCNDDAHLPPTSRQVPTYSCFQNPRRESSAGPYLGGI